MSPFALRTVTRVGMGVAAILMLSGTLLAWQVSGELHGFAAALLAAPICALGFVLSGIIGLLNWGRIKWVWRAMSMIVLGVGTTYIAAVVPYFVEWVMMHLRGLG